jgi:hypothetical protein
LQTVSLRAENLRAAQQQQFAFHHAQMLTRHLPPSHPNDYALYFSTLSNARFSGFSHGPRIDRLAVIVEYGKYIIIGCRILRSGAGSRISCPLTGSRISSVSA